MPPRFVYWTILIDGKPPMKIKAGESYQIPEGAVHDAHELPCPHVGHAEQGGRPHRLHHVGHRRVGGALPPGAVVTEGEQEK